MLIATARFWDTANAYSFAWERCGSNGSCATIPNESSWTYVIRPEDAGWLLRVAVTGRNTSGGTVAYSVLVGPVPGSPSSPPPSSGGNLAPNANLEQDPGPYYSTQGDGAFTWATDAARSGSHSLRISSATGNLSRWFTNTRLIPAQPGTTYTATAWLKTQNSSG